MTITFNNGFSISPFKKGDAAPLAIQISHPSVTSRLLDLPNPYTIVNAEEWIDFNLKYYQEHYNHLNLAIRNSNGDLIGGIGKKLNHGINFAHSCEIGYWLSVKYWNKGIMRKAVRAYVLHLIKIEHFVRITAISFTTNLASAKVLEKSGFKLEGILNKFAAKNDAYLDCFLYAHTQ